MSDTLIPINDPEIGNKVIFSRLENVGEGGILVPGVHSSLQATLEETNENSLLAIHAESCSNIAVLSLKASHRRLEQAEVEKCSTFT